MSKTIFQNKKILIFKKKTYSSYYDLIVNALIEYGKPEEVHYVTYNSESDIVDINDQIRNKILYRNINVFIALSYYFIDPQILIDFKKKLWSIRIDGDDSLIFEHYSKWYAQLFDLNLTTSIICNNKFKELGYKSIVYPTFVSTKKTNLDYSQTIEFKHDISFVGVLRKNMKRNEYISKINKKFKNFIHYGADSKNGFLNIENKYKLYRQTKINLDFSGVGYNQFPQLLDYEPSLKNNQTVTGRCFEVLAAGGFLLCEDNSMLKYFFQIKEDLDVFKNENDLFNKIEYYLKNEKLRKKIANSGYLKFKEKYSYEIYAPKLLSEMEKFIDYRNPINNITWPISVRLFLTRFIKKSRLLNLRYFLFIVKWSDKFYFLRKLIFKFKYFLNRDYYL